MGVALAAALSLGYVAWKTLGDHNGARANERPIDGPSPGELHRLQPSEKPPSSEKPADRDLVSADPPATTEPAKVVNKDPYSGWKLPKAQAGLVSLGFDPLSKLEEFAVDGTGAIPTRDGTKTLVIKARLAFEDEKCALVLVLIPGGDFLMGSLEGSGIDNEHPQHRVDIKPFFIAKTEVNQALWQRVMNSNPSAVKGALLPVTEISAEEASAFSKKLGLALPTEAQWEYACRAGTTTAFSFGDDMQKLGDYAWFKLNISSGPHAIATKLANPWGLYDVHGNVSEWCEDTYRDDYKGVPANGGAWVDASNPRRAMRGGNFFFTGDFTRSAARGMYKGSKSADFVGFRPARLVKD